MDSRLKKLKWNSILALCYQFILIVTGLILPRCYLRFYGSEVYGLISSITQFLAFGNICDLGIGAVVSTAYYKPLADGDTNGISKVFVYSRRFFRTVGAIIAAYVMVLLVIYPTFINHSFDFGYTFILIAAMCISQLGQYFVGISYQLLLNSDQRSYVQLIVNGSTLLINTAISIGLMYIGVSVQIVKLVASMIFLLRPLALHWYVKRYYLLDKQVPVDKTVIPQKRNGVIQHIAYMIYENTDVMVLTVFSTLQNVSIYSIYTLITHNIKQLILSSTTGIQSLLGNMLARNEIDAMKSAYSFYNWSMHTICTFLFTITGLMIVPFVQIYTSGVSDTNYNVPLFAVLITIAFFFSSIRNSQYVLIRVAGHFKQTQTAALIECLLNLFVSIALVVFWGLDGVALGTIVATVFFAVYEIVYFSKNIVMIPMKESIKQFAVDGLIIGVMVVVSAFVRLFNGSILSWILQASVLSVICLATTLLVQSVFYRNNLIAVFKKIKMKMKI